MMLLSQQSESARTHSQPLFGGAQPWTLWWTRWSTCDRRRRRCSTTQVCCGGGQTAGRGWESGRAEHRCGSCHSGSQVGQSGAGRRPRVRSSSGGAGRRAEHVHIGRHLLPAPPQPRSRRSGLRRGASACCPRTWAEGGVSAGAQTASCRGAE